MLRALRSNSKIQTVQTSSPKKTLLQISDDKENSPHMGHAKTEEPVKKSKKKENPPIPKTSKRRCALRGILNSETSEEESAREKSKSLAKDTNKVAKSAGKKAGKTNLTQVKCNLPSSSSLVDKESFIVGNEDIVSTLNETFHVTEFSHQEKETPSGLLDKGDKLNDELEAANQDETCKLRFSTMQSFCINSPPYNNNNILEAKMLTSATPPESYWKELAQQREIAIEKVLKENVSLQDQLEVLQVEMYLLKNVVQQAEDLARVVKDIVE